MHPIILLLYPKFWKSSHAYYTKGIKFYIIFLVHKFPFRFPRKTPKHGPILACEYINIFILLQHFFYWLELVEIWYCTKFLLVCSFCHRRQKAPFKREKTDMIWNDPTRKQDGPKRTGRKKITLLRILRIQGATNFCHTNYWHN